jgi:hypothetical protein
MIDLTPLAEKVIFAIIMAVFIYMIFIHKGKNNLPPKE